MAIYHDGKTVFNRYHGKQQLSKKYHDGKLVWEFNETCRLPKEYQEVEYIKSEEAKIKLNYIPNVNTEVECEFMRNSKTGEQYAFHTYPISSTSNKRCSFMLINADSKRSRGIFGAVNNESDEIRISPISVGSKIKLKFDSKEFSLNNVVYKFKHTSVTLPTMDNMWVFGTRSGANSYMSMYSFKIFEKGEPKVNLVPCYRKADYKGGMYDTVNNTFYPSQTSTDFIVGTKVRCAKVEYCENVNSNYIDLRMKLKSSYKTKIEFQVPQTETENRGVIFGTRGTNTNTLEYSLDKAYGVINWTKINNTPMTVDVWNIYQGDGAKRRYSISEADRYKRLLVEFSDTAIKVDGATVKTNTALTEFETVKSACIFGSPLVCLAATQLLTEYVNAKIYSVEIKDKTDNLLFSLIPYQIGDRVGLLDTVSKVFFDGEFVNKPFVTKQSRMR